jgi:uncharacterized damage-inducible protein DinB
MKTDGIARMYEHMVWADRRLTGRELPADALRLFAHLLAAERVWLLRLRGRSTAGEGIWPELGVEEIERLARENHVGYAELLGDLSAASLDEVIEYRNQAGDPYRTVARDILIHVAMHGAYHRGQIAARVRATGGEPVNTDYITFVRERPGEAE